MQKSGTILGILGGGQLGRMSAMAAARLGISVIIFCPEKNSPASHVAMDTIIANYDDKDALRTFSNRCDYISYEFENIPLTTVEYLESLKESSVLPSKSLLHVSQDRIKEKQFLNDSGIKTARWAAISGMADIEKTMRDWNGNGFVIKTTRFGYDGKGQIKCDANSYKEDPYLRLFLKETKGQDLIMEDLVDFKCEVSSIVARDYIGKTEIYGPMLNEHKNHILHTTTVPSGLNQNTINSIQNVSETIANRVNLTGVLTVEFFIGSNNEILVNEIAPRTHNSGHWSIDACAVSQFENHVRTVCALPVGSTLRHNDALMLNLIGDDINMVDDHIGAPNTCIHLYGKVEARDGRKMGHINFLKPLTQ